MDFSFINELIKSLQANNIYQYTFTGGKVLAFALLVFRFLETFAKDYDALQSKIGNVMSILGYGCVIMSSDWIINSIDNIFAGIEVSMGKTESNLFDQINDRVDSVTDTMFENCSDFSDYLGAIVGTLRLWIGLVIVWVLGLFCKLADLSMTAGYLVQRVFIKELLRFLFPLTIALSTYSGTQKLFHSWILRYIGVFILGISYIGIIKGAGLMEIILLNQFNTDYTQSVNLKFFAGAKEALGLVTVMIVTFSIKIKLFHSITSYVTGMFQ